MSGFTIFVEGVADQRFIKDLVQFHFQLELKLKEDIKSFGGKDKWHLTKEDFKKSINAGKSNLLIFDADSKPEDRRQEIEDKKSELGILFDLFLFPNDTDSGELENLLLQICTDESQSIFECFETYKACIHQVNQDYTKPDLKTRLYAYSEITTGDGKEMKRDYNNTEFWNLNSDALTPLLLNFLKKHLEK